MYYGIFPAAVYAAFLFPDIDRLPIEVFALMLRYLDGASLLNAAKVSIKWRDVILADPLLRKKLKSFIAEERKRRRRFVRNPQEGIRVERQGSTMMFSVNNVNNKNVIRDIRPMYEGNLLINKRVHKPKQQKKNQNAKTKSIRF